LLLLSSSEGDVGADFLIQLLWIIVPPAAIPTTLAVTSRAPFNLALVAKWIIDIIIIPSKIWLLKNIIKTELKNKIH
jgi:hypothetical protein